MTHMVLGGLLGLMLACGLLLALRGLPRTRMIRLGDRIAPYLADTPAPSRLLIRPSTSSAPFTVLRRLVGPITADAVGFLDRVIGGSASVRRRLGGLGATTTVEEFRVEQVVWAALGTVAGAVAALGLSAMRGDPDAVLAGAGAIGGLLTGLLGRDWWLTRQLRQREQAMLAEFPVVADLLALAVVAGEAPGDALLRVCRLTRGALAVDLDAALARSRAGTPLTTALSELAERTTLESFARFLQGLIVGIERGTPLAEVLRSQAVDVREAGKRGLLDAGGRKEISMMFPVVFLILPVTVLFALYPGLLTLESLAH